MIGFVIAVSVFVVALLIVFVAYLQERHSSPPLPPAVKPIVYDPESYGNQ